MTRRAEHAKRGASGYVLTNQALFEYLEASCFSVNKGLTSFGRERILIPMKFASADFLMLSSRRSFVG